MTINNHPSDQLGEIKEQIRNLKMKEKLLKLTLMNMSDSERKGRNYYVHINQRSRKNLNKELLIERVGEDVLRDCYTEKRFKCLTISKL